MKVQDQHQIKPDTQSCQTSVSTCFFYSKHIKRCFYHFQERLKQRYDLDIEINEYVELCKTTEFDLLKISDNNTLVLKIHFKGKEIKVAKQSPEKGFLLITALK